MITITAYTAAGEVLASAAHPSEALLRVDRVYEDGDYIVEPYNGYKVTTYRCKYDKESGELISKAEETTSIYRARDGVKCEIVD